MEYKTKKILNWAGVVVVYIVLIVVLSFCIVTAMHSCSKVANEINERGLKSIVEEVWEGSQQKGE